MKFIIEPQHGIKQDSVIVWDAEKGQELCTFTGGELETEDEYIIERLAELGYESDGEQQPKVLASVSNSFDAENGEPIGYCSVIPASVGEEHYFGDVLYVFISGDLEKLMFQKKQGQNDDDAVIESALRAKAKALGITHTHVKGIEKLTAEISEKEGVQ